MITFNSQPRDLEKSPDIILWRYMSIDELWDMLRRSRIILSNISNFDDPFEGIYLKYLVSKVYSESNQAEYIFNLHKKICKAKCLFQHPNESALMWDLYAKSGVAIQTTAEALIENIGGLNKADPSLRVKYIDYKSKIEDVFSEISNLTLEDIEQNLDNLFCYKLDDFSQENEVRIIESITLHQETEMVDSARRYAIPAMEKSGIKLRKDILSHFKPGMFIHTDIAIHSLNDFIKKIVTTPHAKLSKLSMIEDMIRLINVDNKSNNKEVLNIPVENSRRNINIHYKDTDYFKRCQ